MNRIHAAASAMVRTAVADERVSRLLCRFNRRSRIIMLHGLGTPDYPAAVFRAQLRFLSGVFRLVPLAQVLRTDDGGADSRPKLALTFDDGLRNNFTVAYPVLREFAAPATFFVCPGLVTNRRWLWNHECRARLDRMPRSQRLAFAGELGLETEDIDVIVNVLKYLPNSLRLAKEERLRSLTPGFAPTDGERERYELMTWTDLRELDSTLIDIGGHSSHHEILTRVESSHLESEIAGCRTWIEKELGRPVRHFCYPDGAYDSRVVDCVGRHFDAAVTTKKDWVPTSPVRLTLPRIPVAENIRDLAWRMHRPTG
ncbi:MAG: polysaccharide deacetylase family protein [Steroidobacteraceae bacterium]